jgi:hypothetical protein
MSILLGRRDRAPRLEATLLHRERETQVVLGIDPFNGSLVAQQPRIGVLLLDGSRSEAKADRAAGLPVVVQGCEHERWRRLDVEDQITGCGAVQEMEEPGVDAWRPSAVAVRVEAANHRELPRSRAVVVSVAESRA